MRTFFVSAVLLFFLFLGIFIGIQYAESGIRQVLGDDGPPQDEAVAAQAEAEPVDLSLLGKTFSRGDELLEGAGMEGLSGSEGITGMDEQLGTGNIYADVGAVIGSWIQQGVRGLAELVLGWLDGLL